VADALTSHEYNDVTGCVTINAVDALMAIANAIHRLAVSQEKLVAAHEQATAMAAQRTEAMMHVVAERFPGFGNDGEGHA